MSLADRIATKCTANIRCDIEDTLCIAMSDTGFLTLRDDIERRHSEAACLVEIAEETLRAEKAVLEEVEPVMDIVYAIGSMRSVAAEFGKTPADVEEDMREILKDHAVDAGAFKTPLNSDNCANRLRDILLSRETPEEREAREERDYVEATGGGSSHFNDPIARAERAIGA
jgi:hypothetical protein